jgi:hypothetical protein
LFNTISQPLPTKRAKSREGKGQGETEYRRQYAVGSRQEKVKYLKTKKAKSMERSEGERNRNFTKSPIYNLPKTHF